MTLRKKENEVPGWLNVATETVIIAYFSCEFQRLRCDERWCGIEDGVAATQRAVVRDGGWSGGGYATSGGGGWSQCLCCLLISFQSNARISDLFRFNLKFELAQNRNSFSILAGFVVHFF